MLQHKKELFIHAQSVLMLPYAMKLTEHKSLTLLIFLKNWKTAKIFLQELPDLGLLCLQVLKGICMR